MAKRKCDCGECKRCKHREYMNAWYRRPGNAERVRGWASRYRGENIEQVRGYDRARGFRETDSMKITARRAVRLAIERGDMKREPCEVCEAEPADAHHDDYNKPLEVRWLCEKHHGKEHRLVA
jgi:hypothetical protein